MDAAAFWSKVQPSEFCECWTWNGIVRWNGRPQGVHRVAWELANGPIPPATSVLHRCDNPLCVRPDHLWLGTQRDNIRDMVAKGRRRTGGPLPPARRTEPKEWTLKEPLLTMREAAARLRVHQNTLKRWTLNGKVPAVKIGRDWRFTPDDIERVIEESRVR